MFVLHFYYLLIIIIITIIDCITMSMYVIHIMLLSLFAELNDFFALISEAICKTSSNSFIKKYKNICLCL